MRYLWAAALGLSSAGYGQRLYFGAVAGTSDTADFSLTGYIAPVDVFGNPASQFQFPTGMRSPLLGLSMEARVSESFSIEANVLRRPINSTIVFTEFPVGSPSPSTTNHYTKVGAWEFPLLLKYTLPSGRSARPFLEAGPTIIWARNRWRASR